MALVVATFPKLLLLVLLAFKADGQIAPGSTGSCIAGGYYSCCVEWCNVGDCYCDLACFDFGDCCSDIYSLSNCGFAVCSPSCQNGGDCVGNNLCSCPSTWTGSYCQTPVCNPNCLYGSCVGPNSCSCNSGWTGSACNQDINECGNANGGCEHTCTNTAGSFTCSCTSGYSLGGNGLSCYDVNECNSGNGGCAQTCVNTQGAFYCTCGSGYNLDSNGVSCNDINECTLGTAGCDQVCTNTIGSYVCSCDVGYYLLDDGHACTDHNECLNPNHHSCDQTCHNIPGSYFCSCSVGYDLLDDGYSCLDIDECGEGIAGCNHFCTNTIGSFVCSCQIGYHLLDDQRTCVDTNECLSDNGDCDHICINEIGSFHCECKPGYTLQDDSATCVADPCPSIFAPLNGNMQCTGEQVTDEYCYFDCELGYSLTGSSTRLCQPDHTWTGETTQCPPLECGALMNPENGVIIAPCYDEFLDQCTVMCEPGYLLNGSTIQACNLTSPLINQVEWTEPPFCKAVLPCDPDPCLHGGQCSVSEESLPLCNCTGTFYKGDTCETGLVLVPGIPILVQGMQSKDFTIHAAPTNTLNIGCNVNYQLQMSPSTKLVVKAMETSTNFSLTPKITGVFPIIYTLFGQAVEETNFETPEQSVVLVKSSAASSPSNFFSSIGLSQGQVGVGCCKYNYTFPIPSATCANLITLSSSCNWDNFFGDLVTSGTVFISSEGIDLPVSLVGLGLGGGQGYFSTYLPSEFGGGTRECSQCTQCQPTTTSSECLSSIADSSTTGCQAWSQGVSFDEEDMESMLTANAMSVTFLKKIQTLLPSWLTVVGNSAAVSNGYYLFDYKSFIGSSTDATKLLGCEKLPPSTSGLDYSFRTTTEMYVDIGQNAMIYNPSSTDSSPICFSLDLCLGESSALFVSVPEGLQKLILSLPEFTSLSNIGWEFTFYYLQFHKYGIAVTPFSNPFLIADAYSSDVQSVSYDFLLRGRASGGFVGGNSTTLNVEFVGEMYYKASVSGNEVPGLITADTLELSIGTQVGQNNVTLYLSLDEQPFVFAFPGSSLSASSPITSAVSSRMTYKYSVYSDAAFFSELLMLPGFVSQCPLDTYVQLNENFEVEWVTFASSCVGLRLGKLQFISDFTHYGEIRGLSTYSALAQDNNIAIRSFLTPSTVQLGSFFRIFKDPSSPCLTLYYTSTSSDVSGTLASVNITVFDSEINSDITIKGDSLSFQGETTIFKYYPVLLECTASTVDPWSNIAMDIEGSLKQDGYLNSLNTYLADFIVKKANETTIKRLNAKANLDNSQQLLDSLQVKFAEAEAETNALADEYEVTLNDVNFWTQETSNAETNYNQALQDHTFSQELVDELQYSCPTGACEQVCIPGVACSTCYEQTTLMESGQCPTYKIVQEKQVVYKWYKTQGWRYELRTYTCWGMVRVGLYCTAFSKVCTKIVCASYVEWTSKPETTTVNKVVKEDKPCIVQVYDESAPGECCQEYPCASTVPDPLCVATKMDCQAALEAAQAELSSDEADLMGLYQAYQDAKASLTAAEVTAASKKIELDSSQQKLMILEPALESAQLAVETSQLYYNQVLEETSSLQILVDLLNKTEDSSTVLSVTHMSFSERIHTDTPIAFPIKVSYSSSTSSHQISVVVNFESPKELVLRGFSEAVVDHYLTMMDGNFNGRRRRQLITIETNNLYEQFQGRCTDMQNMKTYFTQIASTMNSSMQSLEETLFLIYNISNTTDSIMNSSKSVPELEDVYSTLAANTSNASSSLASVAEESAFPHWQTTMQLLHNSSVTVGGYPCTGFSSCLQVAADVVQVLLEDSPGDEAYALLTELLGNKDGLLELGYVKDLSLQEASSRLEYIVSIINATEELGYWCAEPPEIVENPPLEVNVSIGDMFSLTCQANSSLPVTYQWKKDGLLLNVPKTNVLTFLDVQMVEAGNYSCVAFNAVGSTSSLATRVNIYYAPIFNGTITDTETLEGNDNGVNLACDAHSWPPPGWRWLYRASSSDNWTQVEGIDVNVLPLDNPRVDDEGWYMCVAENWMGNASSNPIYLTVLPVAIVRIKYPITFLVKDNGNLFQYLEDDQGSAMQIDPEPIVFALTASLGLNLTQIENVVVDFETSDTANQSSISLDLIMPQLVPSDLPSMTFEDLLVFATPAMMEVMEAAATLPQVLTNPGITIVTDEGEYQIVNTSLVFGTRAFTCPQGYMLHDSLILCVACSPGQYQGPPKVVLTDLGNGEFIHEEMDQCFACPVGSYQDEKATTSCNMCPHSHSTTSMGSKSVEDCRGYCQPATISQTGLEPCHPCPDRYYQLEYGATGCLPCPSHDDITHIQCYIPTVPLTSETSSPTETSINIAIIAGGAAAGAGLVLLIVIIVVVVVVVTYHQHAKYGISGKKLEDIDPDFEDGDTMPIVSSVPFESDKATKLDIKGPKGKRLKKQTQSTAMGDIPHESDKVKKLMIGGAKKSKGKGKGILAVTSNPVYGELEEEGIESVGDQGKQNPLYAAIGDAEISEMIGTELVHNN